MGAIRAAVALAAVGLLAGCGAPPGEPAAHPVTTGPVPSETACTAVLCTQPVPSTGSSASVPARDPELPSYPADGYPAASPSPVATCPADAPSGSAILAAARQVSHGRLPDGTVVGVPRCAGDYLVADLTAPTIGTIHVVLHRTATGWRAVAVGSYPCKSVTTAPPEARALLNC